MGWPQPRPEAVAAALAWLREQDPRLSLDALAAKLREQGYQEAEITAATAARQAEIDAATHADGDLRGKAAVILIAAYFITWAVVSFLVEAPGSGQYGLRYLGLAAIILAGVLGVLMLLSLIGVYNSRRLRTGVEGALIGVLAIPFVFLAIVAGLCVATTIGQGV